VTLLPACPTPPVPGRTIRMGETGTVDCKGKVNGKPATGPGKLGVAGARHCRS